MHIYTKIYEFAASLGAFEGYVYHREGIDPDGLPKWVNNIVGAYQHLTPEVRNEFQYSLDKTAGRAVKSLVPILGEKHQVIRKLNSIIVGTLPDSPDDFQMGKWFQKNTND